MLCPKNNLRSPKETAFQLRYSEGALKNSRSTGILAGVKSPKYIKIGRKIFYPQDYIDEWLSQFPECRSTSEYKDKN